MDGPKVKGQKGGREEDEEWGELVSISAWKLCGEKGGKRERKM